MISLGKQFPQFDKKAVFSIEPGKEFGNITSECHKKNKQWMVMFWYPKDFTFVCPTELAEFNNRYDDFINKNTMLVSASTDTEYVHLAWRNSHPDLKELKFPMLADSSKSLADSLGILTDDDEKFAYRVTFIVNPDGFIQWICANNLDVGRNVDEVLRVLDGLQIGGLIPCNWKPGEKTL
jgi:lipoyl-dependent peroxiredoxin subunit C